MKSKHLNLPKQTCRCPHPPNECKTTLEVSYFAGATHASLYIWPDQHQAPHNGITLDWQGIDILIASLAQVLAHMPKPEEQPE